MIQSWSSLVKKELIYLLKLRSRPRATFASSEMFSNGQQLPRTLDFRTPPDVEAAYPAGPVNISRALIVQ